MNETLPLLAALSAALREARRARRVSIAALSLEAGVSPRLISEFEQGKRPHVSLATALRLLHLTGVPVQVAGAPAELDADRARAERAARRRRTWAGSQSTVATQEDPAAPASTAGRLAAVARASVLAVSLRQAPRAAKR